MLEFDVLQITLHVVNILLWVGIAFLCVKAYRYLSKKLQKSRSSN